jgi:hypothetical protein
MDDIIKGALFFAAFWFFVVSPHGPATPLMLLSIQCDKRDARRRDQRAQRVAADGGESTHELDMRSARLTDID